MTDTEIQREEIEIPDDIVNIVTADGNNFHSRIVQTLRERDWHVVVSPYYMDSTTNKPREIDLIAEKPFPVLDYGRTVGTLNVKLFVECKYFPKPVVFWMDNKDNQRAKKLVISKTNLEADNAYTDRHHYVSTNDKVVKLFSAGNSRELHNELMYKALNQCLNAMVYNSYQGSILPDVARGRRLPTLLSVEYPIIVCNSFDNFYSVQMSNQDEIRKVEDNFQLEVDYAYKDRSGVNQKDYFLIDVISEQTLEQFEALVACDVEAMSVFLGD